MKSWSRLFKGPELSVIIPTYNRVEELKLCLEGFTQQTAPPEQFQVVVVDDGSSDDVKSVIEPFRKSLDLKFISTENGGPSVARNLAIANAAAPLLLLYDDDLRPTPGAVSSCLDFHRRYPQTEHAQLLFFRPDDSLLDCPVLHWAFRLLYPFPMEEGLFSWQFFWAGTITCKKSLFSELRFNPDFRTLEDAEIALRMSRRFDMRIHFDGSAHGTMTRRLRFSDVCKRQYLGGYFGYQLARVHPGKMQFGPPYDDVDKYFISNPMELKGVFGAAKRLEAEAIRSESPASERLAALWKRAEIHARVSGWIAARDGGARLCGERIPVPAFE